VVNRSRHAAAAFTVDAGRLGDGSILETHTLNDDDIYAANTLEDQNRVTLAPNETARVDGGQLTVELPPRLLDGHRLGLTAHAGERPSESADGSDRFPEGAPLFDLASAASTTRSEQATAGVPHAP
jgi:hypothetical protein